MEYSVLRQVFTKTEHTGSFSFESAFTRVEIIRSPQGMEFIRIYEKTCSAEDNGRPATKISDYAYPVADGSRVTPENWKQFRNDTFPERIELNLAFIDGIS